MRRYYRRNENFFRNFSTIFFYVSDPGAWAVLRPFGDFLRGKGHACRFLLEGWAGAHVAPILKSSDFVPLEELGRVAPDGSALLVYGAQQNFWKNYEMISTSRREGLATLFVFDSWKNYLINFRDPRDGSMYLPSRIAVVDERMKEGVLRSLSGYVPGDLEQRIDILGHPAMDASVTYIRCLPQERISALRCRYGEGHTKLRLFVMEPIREDFLRVNGIDLGYDEYSILEYFLTRCCQEDSKVLVKVHPRQNGDEVQEFIRLDKGRGQRRSVQVISDEKIEDLIAIADEVYGMTSIALNVAIRCGKVVRSIQVGRNENGKTLSNPDLEACLIE